MGTLGLWKKTKKIFESKMVLLHGFIKKGKKTPQKDLRLAKDRLKKFNKKQTGRD